VLEPIPHATSEDLVGRRAGVTTVRRPIDEDAAVEEREVDEAFAVQELDQRGHRGVLANHSSSK
jgi:hypothetical protein